MYWPFSECLVDASSPQSAAAEPDLAECISEITDQSEVWTGGSHARSTSNRVRWFRLYTPPISVYRIQPHTGIAPYARHICFALYRISCRQLSDYLKLCFTLIPKLLTKVLQETSGDHLKEDLLSMQNSYLLERASGYLKDTSSLGINVQKERPLLSAMGPLSMTLTVKFTASTHWLA